MNASEDTDLTHDLGNLKLGDAGNSNVEVDTTARTLDSATSITKIQSNLSGIDHVLETLREVRN